MKAKEIKSDFRLLYYNGINPENISEHVNAKGIAKLEEASKFLGYDSFESAYYCILSRHILKK